MYHLEKGRSTEQWVYNVNMATKSISSLSAMDDFASDFLQKIAPANGARVLCLKGDLGAGKTAFVKSVAKALGITEHVTSPTFVIQKTYPISATSQMPSSIFHSLVHIDAYRLESGDELVKLNWAETCADKGNLIMLEWPERVQDILPKDVTTLNFKFIDETTREIDF